MKTRLKQIAHYALLVAYVACAVALLFLAVEGVYELAKLALASDLVHRFWWVPFSAAYTIGSIVWTWRAEQRLRALKDEARILGHLIDHQSAKLVEVENYLESGATLPEIKTAPAIVFPLVVPRVNVDKEGA